MAEWSQDHVAAIGPFKTQLCFSCFVVAKLETGRGP
jgi:hypothetical protein